MATKSCMSRRQLADWHCSSQKLVCPVGGQGHHQLALFFLFIFFFPFLPVTGLRDREKTPRRVGKRPCQSVVGLKFGMRPRRLGLTGCLLETLLPSPKNKQHSLTEATSPPQALLSPVLAETRLHEEPEVYAVRHDTYMVCRT